MTPASRSGTRAVRLPAPAREPRVAVVALGDPTSPATWSGTTLGVVSGLRDLGIAVDPIDLTLPRPAELALLLAGAARTRNRFDAQSAAGTMKLRSRLAQHALGVRKLKFAVQVGTNYLLPAGLTYVTLEDMTLRQGLAIHPVFSKLSGRTVRDWEALRELVYRRARRCTAASHWAAESLVRDYGVAPERVMVVGLGANHRPAQGGLGERDWSVPRFLFVGMDWERKGGPELLRAFARLRRVRSDAELHLVGAHPAIRAPGIVDHGLLIGSRLPDRDRLEQLFARATCMVMPSQVEPFGIVHIEAAEAGLASICTSVGGPRDLIGDDGGILVEPGAEDALLAAMIALSDPDAARRMGLAARERARLYTWRKVAERLTRALGLQAPDGAKLAEGL